MHLAQDNIDGRHASCLKWVWLDCENSLDLTIKQLETDSTKAEDSFKMVILLFSERCLNCAMERNVMEHFKPGELMRIMFYAVMTQAYSEKEILSAPIRS